MAGSDSEMKHTYKHHYVISMINQVSILFLIFPEQDRAMSCIRRKPHMEKGWVRNRDHSLLQRLWGFSYNS